MSRFFNWDTLGTGCRSTQNKTVSIPGPNGEFLFFFCVNIFLSENINRFLVGDTCIEVIEKCSCTSACYRATSMEHVYDYTLQDGDGDLDEVTGAKIKVVYSNEK